MTMEIESFLVGFVTSLAKDFVVGSVRKASAEERI